MQFLKKLCNKFYHMSNLCMAGLCVLAAALLIVIFTNGLDETPLAYTVYPFSAAMLILLVIRLPRCVRTLKKKFFTQKHVKKAMELPIVTQFLEDMGFRGTISIYQGFSMNLLYALFRGITAFLYSSVWFGVIAVYYFMLCVFRGLLAHSVRGTSKTDNLHMRSIQEYKSYRMCGLLMFLLTGGMSGMAVLMVRDNMHFTYPGYIIYLSAAYTFYITIMAVINMVKFRKLKSPVLSASKALTFAGALMSVLALQTSMIAQFGGDDSFRKLMNMITSTAVCSGVIIIAIYMVWNADRRLKSLQENS
ncbi:MAG: hypothetical protein NC433_14690 [Clostridiales bacterium]|nr:hypothetical protein [Clostridiales bacterium]